MRFKCKFNIVLYCATVIDFTIDYDEFESLVNLKLICFKGIRSYSRVSNRKNYSGYSEYTGYTISIISNIVVCWFVSGESICWINGFLNITVQFVKATLLSIR